MNSGVPPTERNARTGELTPAGMTSCARWNSCWLRFISAHRESRVTGHEARVSSSRRENNALKRRAASLTSAAPNSAEITATPSAPAAISCGALSSVMPPMATTGVESRRLALAQQGERRAHRARLHAGGKEASECDIVGAQSLGLLREFEPVVAGGAKDLFRPEPRACRGERTVLSAQVQAVGIQGQREIEVVVDDERDLVLPAQREQRPSLQRVSTPRWPTCCGTAASARRRRAPLLPRRAGPACRRRRA